MSKKYFRLVDTVSKDSWELRSDGSAVFCPIVLDRASLRPSLGFGTGTKWDACGSFNS